MKKSLYYKFKETSLAVDESTACDHMKELEKTVDYESSMRENVLRVDQCTRPKFRIWKSLDCRLVCLIRLSTQLQHVRKRRC